MASFTTEKDTMQQSTITIDIQLDPEKFPSKISWKATGSSAEEEQQARGMMLALWDGSEKTALRIDLWTKEMMVDEMADFFYQTIMSMADTYHRATANEEMMQDMKNFAKSFYKKFQAQQIKENAAG